LQYFDFQIKIVVELKIVPVEVTIAKEQNNKGIIDGKYIKNSIRLIF